MTSHLAVLALFAALVSSVFATLMKDTPREQLRSGTVMFGGFLATAIVLAWLLYPLPL